jgi:hypothetical protein
MKKANPIKRRDPDMRDEYQIPWDKAQRGKYAGRFKTDCYFVPIDPNLKPAFPTADSVNAALHALVDIARRETKPKTRRKSA